MFAANLEYLGMTRDGLVHAKPMVARSEESFENEKSHFRENVFWCIHYINQLKL